MASCDLLVRDDGFIDDECVECVVFFYDGDDLHHDEPSVGRCMGSDESNVVSVCGDIRDDCCSFRVSESALADRGLCL